MAISDCFVSVVAPLRNDADIVQGFVEETVDVLGENYANFEVLLVDDGSDDETVEVVRPLLGKHVCIRLLRLSRRFGQEIAISAGLDSVIGDFVVVILPETDPPSLIPRMVEQSRRGTGIVFGIRRDRKDEPLHLRLGAAGFYWISNRLLKLGLPKNSTHFQVLSRQAVNAVIQIKDRFRYLRTLSNYVGYENQSFVYDYVARRSPPRRKTLWEALNLSIAIIVANSLQPLRVISLLGLAATGVNVLYMVYIVLIYLFKSDVREGWVTQSMQNAVMFFFLFLILTALCEYVGRLLSEVRERPLYYIMGEETSSVLLVDETRKNVVSDSITSRSG